MSAFDPTSILDTEIVGELSTHTIPVPEADDAPGIIEDEKAISAQQFTKEGKTSTLLTVMWTVDTEEARAATGLEKPRVPQKIWLDMTDDGRIDTDEGKNVGLGKLREALGLNTEDAFTFRQLIGQVGALRIRHRADQNDPEQKYAEVKAVASV